MINIDDLARDIYDALIQSSPEAYLRDLNLNESLHIDGNFSMRAVAALLAVKMMERGHAVINVTPFAERPREAIDKFDQTITQASLLGELLAVIHRDGGHYQDKHGTLRAVSDGIKAIQTERVTTKPIDMILYCPACGTQHIDAQTEILANAPHRSHLCHACDHIWRPADYPTNGVSSIATQGEDDSPAPPAKRS